VRDLSITLFGPPQIKRGNEQISIQRRKDLALLIYLASTSRPQSRDTLATLLWQDQTQTEARSNLRKSLSRLRSILGEDSIITAQEQVQLNPDLSIDLDITRFQQQIQQFKKHGHVRSDSAPHLCRECQNALQAAAALYQADFLQAFSLPNSPAFEEWQFFQAENLRQNLAEALEHLIHQFTFTGEYSAGIEYGRRRLALDRFHEAAHKQLMILYALNNQYAAAIRQFEECVRILKDELGAQPESDTLKVYEAIRRKKIHDLLNLSKDLKTSAGYEREQEKSSALRPRIAHNLPVHPTPIVARENELKETVRLLKEPFCRLLTLLGPGGSGKTRLALQIATSIASDYDKRFKDGIWFVSLAPLTDPQSIAGAIAEALQISGFLKGVDAREKLLRYLRGHRMMLVLDNFEHLLGDESIELVADLLKAAPYGQILVTSRERLNIEGEYIFQVEGLEIPAETASLSDPDVKLGPRAFGALELFEQCARRVQPSFKITKQNFLPIAQICRSVQGMPLAIELAAAWLQVLSPEEIRKEIERSLDFLESNWRDLPDRQRSLRAVFDSSWVLLDKQSRPILKALSVFRSGFTREAAQAVAGASAKTLLDFANKSWIQKTSNGRYQIHELLRQYTFEILQKEKVSFDQVEKQYCAYYADFSFSLWQMLKGPDPSRAFMEAENEFENMRTAWLLLVSHKSLGSAVERMLPILFHYCEVHGKVPELMKLVETGVKAVEAPGGEWQPKTEVILRTVQGAFYVDGFSVRLSVNEAIFPNNLAAIQRAWSLSHREIEFEELGFWGIVLAFLYARIVKFEDGLAQLEHLLLHFQRQGASWELANVYLHTARLLLCNRGELLNQQDTLIQYLSQAMELFSSLEDRINVAYTLTQWGELKFYEQDLKEAIQQWEAARSMLLTIGEWAMPTEMLWNISELYLQLGFFQKAFDGFREISNTYLERGLIQQAVGCLSKLSFEKVRYGDLSEALSIRQRCLTMVQEAGLEYQFAWNYWEMGEVMRVSGDLTEASVWFDRSRQVFENFGDHLGSSFYYRGMGDVALARKDYQLAQDNFAKSAELARAAKHTWMLIYALTGLGRSQLAFQNLDLAGQYLGEALELSSRVKDKGIALMVLGGVTELLTCLRRPQEAIEVGSLVENHFAGWHETKNQMSTSLSSLKKSTTAGDYKQAQRRGGSLELWDTVDRLVVQLQKQKKRARAIPKQKGSRE
jgi:predicted ATPase/DNA-binding SARP family transcriptional activator/tetratricopeptide (TPR) repeat protein